MEKNWLIRTVQKQILGPVSRDKVIDFVKKGSLRPQDEICSGNGYWFRIEEKDLLRKYLFDAEKQGFNPVTEVQPSLEGPKGQTMVMDLANLDLDSEDNAESALPNENDLEYPEDDPAKVEQKNIKYPEDNDLQYPEMDFVSKSDQDLELPQDDEIALELEETEDK